MSENVSSSDTETRPVDRPSRPPASALRHAKVLVLHNRYQQRGGEDEVFDQEVELLRGHGHTVSEFVETNENLASDHRISSGLGAIWASHTVNRLRRLLRDQQPDIAHFHNTFARISPAAYYACHQAGVPVVQTLHNFRIGCLNGCCSIRGRHCERCLPHWIPWAGIAQGCYRNSRGTSAAMAAITATHKVLGTYRRHVDAYIALTEFARTLHVRSGLPEDRLFVKPNFTAPQPEGPPPEQRSYVLYVGRLCPEKGIATLLEAWEKADLGIPLRVVGNGPSAGAVVRAASQLRGVQWLGSRPHAEAVELLRHAQFLVMPSLLYENFPLCIVEAFSAAVPVIASGHGSLREIVEHGQTGLHFETGNSRDLAEQMRWMAANPSRREQMGRAARRRYSADFTPERNYERLLQIYDAAAARLQADA